jgi:hypothetical protein
MTAEEHRAFAAELLTTRQRLRALARGTHGRGRPGVAAAWRNVDRALHLLAIRLDDALHPAAVDAAYRDGVTDDDDDDDDDAEGAAPADGRPLTPEELLGVVAGLHRVRGFVDGLCGRLGRYARASAVRRACGRSLRAADRLREMLDPPSR